ncbi:MAG: hypothetical protein ACYDEX_04130 [Mobilitalea sp.]
MKLRNRVLSAFAATVLALSMMVGTALAQTDVLPFDMPNEANAPTSNDVWVVLFGGTAATPLTDDVALRDSVDSVDVVITGNASFNAEVIYNFTGGWVPTAYNEQTVDGELTINVPAPGKDAGYAEIIVNLKDKTEGALQITRLDFKDEAGNVVLSHGAASAAPAAEEEAAAPAEEAAVPQTGVLSAALFLGLGAAAFGTGAVALKKKQR